MSIPGKLKRLISSTVKFSSKKTYSAADAYRIWADTYDLEQDNLMLYYDKIILNELISQIKLKGKVILDYGCGTGRNWEYLLKYNPAKIIGCDVSPEMLSKLKLKHLNAETYLVKSDRPTFLNDNQCDVILSTLVVAHIKNIMELFAEWNRVIKTSGDIIITDFHPTLLAKGGSRTFKHENESITIENFIYPITEIERSLSSFGFRTVNLIEKKIEDDVKYFYEKHNALNVYEKFKGIPFIYGIHMSR